MQAPIAHILESPHERHLLRMAYERERRFCEDKIHRIEGNAGVDALDALLQGVTYDAQGMGGSYGGMPRMGRSLLDGIMDVDSDVDTDEDFGSEATDLADSDVELQSRSELQSRRRGEAEAAKVEAEVAQAAAAAKAAREKNDELAAMAAALNGTAAMEIDALA